MHSKEDFVAAMMATQDDRTDVAGGHIWEATIHRYGPAMMYAEIASINSRLEQIFWNKNGVADGFTHTIDNDNLERARDLLVDLGNYASFLYAWVDEELPVRGAGFKAQDIVEPEGNLQKQLEKEQGR